MNAKSTRPSHSVAQRAYSGRAGRCFWFFAVYYSTQRAALSFCSQIDNRFCKCVLNWIYIGQKFSHPKKKCTLNIGHNIDDTLQFSIFATKYLAAVANVAKIQRNKKRFRRLRSAPHDRLRSDVLPYQIRWLLSMIWLSIKLKNTEVLYVPPDRFSTDFNILDTIMCAAGQENSTKLKLKRFDRCVILFNERLNIYRTKGK